MARKVFGDVTMWKHHRLDATTSVNIRYGFISSPSEVIVSLSMITSLTSGSRESSRYLIRVLITRATNRAIKSRQRQDDQEYKMTNIFDDNDTYGVQVRIVMKDLSRIRFVRPLFYIRSLGSRVQGTHIEAISTHKGFAASIEAVPEETETSFESFQR